MNYNEVARAFCSGRDEAEQLAHEHWKYVESILHQQLDVMEKMFKDAFAHGYKHGRKRRWVKPSHQSTPEQPKAG